MNAFIVTGKEAGKMTIQKINDKYWVIENGKPKREATPQEIKRFLVKNLIDKLQMA